MRRIVDEIGNVTDLVSRISSISVQQHDAVRQVCEFHILSREVEGLVTAEIIAAQRGHDRSDIARVQQRAPAPAAAMQASSGPSGSA